MKRFITLCVIMALVCITHFSLSQANINALPAQRETHSGIIHVASAIEEYTLLKLHCDALDDTQTEALIRQEFGKYPDLIHSVSIQAEQNKIYIKYNAGMTPNFVLAILERVAINAHYLDTQGHPVYYLKDPDIYFRP